ncbi:hypothetical protein STEG23_030391, partial [Scotinomys teguina]
MARKAGQGKEEEESRARQQKEKTPVRDEEKTPACDGRGHHVVEQGSISNILGITGIPKDGLQNLANTLEGDKDLNSPRELSAEAEKELAIVEKTIREAHVDRVNPELKCILVILPSRHSPQFIYMVYYIDRLSYVEPSLYLWDKAYLVMVDNVFDVFLESICHYFIEYLCIYVHEGDCHYISIFISDFIDLDALSAF